jgi:hypothetical protein
MISAPKGRLNRWSFVVWLVGYTFEILLENGRLNSVGRRKNRRSIKFL